MFGIQGFQTLYDAIKGHEREFERVIYAAIENSLVNLGPRIYELDWANVSVSMRRDVAEAA